VPKISANIIVKIGKLELSRIGKRQITERTQAEGFKRAEKTEE